METFTGLRFGAFQRLLKVVRERGGNGTMRGRPWCLPLGERVLLVAVYYRTNLTMRQLAPLFGVSPATVCRVIRKLGPLLTLEPVTPPADAADRLWIVDGTLIPVRDRTIAASSRNYRFSANVQVIIDADTRLVVATARPAPGNKGRRPGVAELRAGPALRGRHRAGRRRVLQHRPGGAAPQTPAARSATPPGTTCHGAHASRPHYRKPRTDSPAPVPPSAAR
ncbi:hypothetical protein FHS40_008056 [Streptomyces spectabilis]|uniref:Transposase Helix-turn-helix domain-containing protein n=1 Tax=Streptomyces spectabilis TaxID=68270 RepID=A0A7W8B234_STRST|nr:hypothetical protein [Streptomyces spectabilis]